MNARKATPEIRELRFENGGLSTESRPADREWLDHGGLQPTEVHTNLRDLELINRWLGGWRSIVPCVIRVMKSAPTRGPFRILDVACGAGDLLRQIVKHARRDDRVILGIGLDRNERVLDHAREKSANYPELIWVRADALALPFSSGAFDLVMCSCFLHHLDPPEATRLLAEAARLSRGGIVVSDLVSGANWQFAPLAFRLLCRLARLHPVTRHDGLLSLQRAYRPDQLAEIAHAAGLTDVNLLRHPFSRATLVNGDH